jgi:hypothetical protein
MFFREAGDLFMSRNYRGVWGLNMKNLVAGMEAAEPAGQLAGQGVPAGPLRIGELAPLVGPVYAAAEVDSG